MTRILVTGGAGYVGSVSVEAFLAAGHDVVVLDDLTTGHRAAVPPGARLQVGTYTDGEALGRLLDDERIEAILHCAARSLVGESIADPARYYRDNVAGGIALLEAARAGGVGRLVFSSTAAVYGVPDATPIPEDAPLRPINPYGETKRSFESALAWYGRAYGLRSVTLRYFNVAGATEALGEDHDPETHLIPTVLQAAEGGSELTIFGDDYPTPGRHLHPRLHPRRGPRRRPPPGARGDRSRRPADGLSRSSATSATAAGSRSGRSSPRPRPSSGRRSRSPSARVAPATRRSSSPAPPERRRSSAGDPIRPTLEEMVGSAWAGDRRGRRATPTDPTALRRRAASSPTDDGLSPTGTIWR